MHISYFITAALITYAVFQQRARTALRRASVIAQRQRNLR